MPIHNKTLIIFSFILVFLVSGFLIQKIDSSKFLNDTKNTQDGYAQDSLIILKDLYQLLFNKKEFFSKSAYFDATQISIDTLLYSPGLDKLAAIIIVKNPTYRLLSFDAHYNSYFDATCYVGMRIEDSIKLYWLGPNFAYFYDRNKLINIVREKCLYNFKTKDTIGPFAHNFNLNDKRFWDNDPVWNLIKLK